ncbi:hypothetical protein QU887_20680, partial [Escherichia coli]|nr:hypothetical protein [Escherichia coli]
MFQNDIFDEDQNSTWHAESTDNYFIVTERYSDNTGHCCKVSDEAAFCLIQRPYISKTLLT